MFTVEDRKYCLNHFSQNFRKKEKSLNFQMYIQLFFIEFELQKEAS